VRYQAALRPDIEASLILDHFWTEHSVEIRFQPQKVSKPSLLPRAAGFKLELHLPVLPEDFRALSKHLRAPQGRVHGCQLFSGALIGFCHRNN
jgi:hypothetical protein